MSVTATAPARADDTVADLAEILFCSNLQPSAQPSAAQVEHVLIAAIVHGHADVPALMAAEYGRHPENAAARMRWALAVIAGLAP